MMTDYDCLQKKFAVGSFETFEKFSEEFLGYIGDFTKISKITGLYAKLFYYPDISNTHHCPLNGVTNFVRKEGLPMHYPGFYGKIFYFMKKSHSLRSMPSGINLGGGSSFSVSDVIDALNHPIKSPQYQEELLENVKESLHTDKGQSLKYEIIIYTSDFPYLQQLIDHYLTMAVISDNTLRPLLEFKWTDKKFFPNIANAMTIG